MISPIFFTVRTTYSSTKIKIIFASKISVIYNIAFYIQKLCMLNYYFFVHTLT